MAMHQEEKSDEATDDAIVSETAEVESDVVFDLHENNAPKKEAQVLERSKTHTHAPASERSWSLAAFVIIAGLVVADHFVMRMGTANFWPLINAYLVSYLVRFILLIVALYIVRRLLPRTRSVALVVVVFIGVLAGTASALIRFVIEQKIWTFFNILTEPVDMVLLALAAYGGMHLITNKFNKQITSHA